MIVKRCSFELWKNLSAGALLVDPIVSMWTAWDGVLFYGYFQWYFSHCIVFLSGCLASLIFRKVVTCLSSWDLFKFFPMDSLRKYPSYQVFLPLISIRTCTLYCEGVYVSSKQIFPEILWLCLSSRELIMLWLPSPESWQNCLVSLILTLSRVEISTFFYLYV